MQTDHSLQQQHQQKTKQIHIGYQPSNNISMGFKIFVCISLALVVVLVMSLLVGEMGRLGTGSVVEVQEGQEGQEGQKGQEGQSEGKKEVKDKQEDQGNASSNKKQQKLIVTEINAPKFRYKLNLSDAPQILNISSLTQPLFLPFCIIIPFPTPPQPIIDSLSNQNYPNYHILTPDPSPQPSNYHNYKEKIQTQCPKNTLLLFLNEPVEKQLLHQLNKIHTKYNTWITYSRNNQGYELLSFYWRIYELLEINDFNGTNRKFLSNGTKEVQMLGIMELASQYTRNVQLAPGVSYYRMPDKIVKYERQPYNRLVRLSQDYDANVTRAFEVRHKLQQSLSSPTNRSQNLAIYKAAQRQDLHYLPRNHPIQLLSYFQYSQNYHINQSYPEVPFCITVLNYNNIQHGRLRRALASVLMQQYSKYRIIFVDDASDDGSMAQARRILKGLGQDRVVLVQNLERMYATHNILNAAYNYCKDDEYQLLLDGDDEIISRHAFQIINSRYQQQPRLWIVWTGYKDNDYGLHRWRGIGAVTDYLDLKTNTRRSSSAIGPIRTWKVQLIKAIPLQHHKMPNNEWYNTMYDQALQHPLLQLSGPNRVLFVKEVLYEYNLGYGGNDNSTPEKIKRRQELYYGHMMKMKPLKEVKEVEELKKDERVEKELKAGEGSKYVVVELVEQQKQLEGNARQSQEMINKTSNSQKSDQKAQLPPLN